MILYMKQFTSCFHYLWNLKNQLEKSIFYRKNREKTEFFFLRINRISKMTTSSTPMLLLQNFLALEKSEIKFGEFEKFHWEIQSALVFMKIKSSGLRPLDPPSLVGVPSLLLVFLFHFFFTSNPLILWTSNF